ncbi:homocysteine S-methyltransferase family protein [Maricaulis sp.]|uniref:homocysteine S-methyltransferase family protein n=1 Tax=Maricaulis sp. TaxID=1486257 RepID=UPI00261717F9|nr:homocysteine S-methyltransferase family protein [Maricaulis sp.]MDF1769341.1 homocysteine S-methyltransferase family protein [Maricaulis sp.]
MSRARRIAHFEQRATDRILILDGAMGTQIQDLKLDEDGYRGVRFADWGVSIKGNNDILNLTAPDSVKAIHRAYFEAGADIVETNTFSATSIAQADYEMQALAPEIAREGARLAREAADEVARETGLERGVAGAIGPTNKTLSISPDVNDPGHRDVDFETVRAAYLEQAEAMAPFVDFFLIETIFDTLNAKAAIKALLDRQAASGDAIPIMISGTITDRSGRTLSGQTAEAFWYSVCHARPWAIGLNCALGADEMRPYISEISRVAETRIIAYPNAGLPNDMGEYDETPDQTAGHLGEWAGSGLVNILGGCCGTTPAHIHAIAAAANSAEPRRPAERKRAMRLSGLEPFELAS